MGNKNMNKKTVPIKASRLVITLSGLATAALAANARADGDIRFPSDGETVTQWVVECASLDDEDEGRAGTVDLSNSVIVESFDCHYRVYGDSLVSRRRLMEKDWFALRPDGVWSVGWNDRRTQRKYRRGFPYLPLTPDGAATVDSVTVTNADLTAGQAVRTSALRISDGCGFVFAGGDTVRATVLYDERATETAADSAGHAISLRERRWYADGCPLPVVQCAEQSADGRSARVVIICPPSEQPRVAQPAQRRAPIRAVKSPDGKTPGSAATVTLIEEEPIAGDFSVSATGGTIAISAAASGAAVSVSVYDTAGRLMAFGGASVSLSGLPAGVYIAEVSVGGVSAPVKLRVDGSGR